MLSKAETDFKERMISLLRDAPEAESHPGVGTDMHTGQVDGPKVDCWSRAGVLKPQPSNLTDPSGWTATGRRG